MRRDIKLWMKACAAFIAYNVWRNRKSELYSHGQSPVHFTLRMLICGAWQTDHIKWRDFATYELYM